MRRTNVAEKGSRDSAARGSGIWPLTRSSRRDRNRVSRKKNPCGDPGNRSPERPEMQKAEPSTRVTVPLPPTLGTSLE